VITAVDANVMIDVFVDDARFASASAAALRRCSMEGRVVVGGSALVEVLSGFADPVAGLSAVSSLGIEHLPLSKEGAVAAARSRQRAIEGGAPRDRLLPDFLIGGHAMAQSDRLLTRDMGFFSRWFPGLTLLDPAG
jgi:hypothetical protein